MEIRAEILHQLEFAKSVETPETSQARNFRIDDVGIGDSQHREANCTGNGGTLRSAGGILGKPTSTPAFKQMNLRLDVKNEGSIRQRIPSSTEMYWRTLVSNAGSVLE